MGDNLGLRNGSKWWKDLCRVCDTGLQGNWFDRRIQWYVGDGRCIKFWEDRWADGQILEELFPRLYSISQNKDSMVGDLVEWEGSRTTRCLNWNLN